MRDALDRMPVGDLAPTPGVAETLQKGVGPLLQVVWPKDAKPEDWEWFEQTRKPRCLSLLDLVEPVEYQLPHLEIVFLYEAAGIVADVPNWHPDWLLAWGRTEPEWTIVFGPRSQWLKEREELVAKLRAR
jgi:hypothetical protein